MAAASTAGGWRRPPSGSGPSFSATGNGGNVGDRVRHAQLLSRAGFDVLLFDYRGYGRSTGTPGEQGTVIDARSARQALLDEAGEEPIIMGESLGGGVAVKLALEHPPRGLVLAVGIHQRP